MSVTFNRRWSSQRWYVDRGQTNYVHGCDWTNRNCSVFATRGVERLQHKRRPAEGQFYRFSAFWLRSSRNNCSLEFNSSNGGIAPQAINSIFADRDEE